MGRSGMGWVGRAWHRFWASQLPWTWQAGGAVGSLRGTSVGTSGLGGGPVSIGSGWVTP